jgi:hypothetical protein
MSAEARVRVGDRGRGGSGACDARGDCAGGRGGIDEFRLELRRSEAFGEAGIEEPVGQPAVGDVGLLCFAEGEDGRLGRLLRRLEKKLANDARAGDDSLPPRDAGDGGLFGCGDSIHDCCDCGLADAEDGLARNGALVSAPSLPDPGFGEADVGLPARRGFVSLPKISSKRVALAPAAVADIGRVGLWNVTPSVVPTPPSDAPDDLALRCPVPISRPARTTDGGLRLGVPSFGCGLWLL